MANMKNLKTISHLRKNVHECTGNADRYCYLCGDFKMKTNLKNFNENLRQIYQRCFECEVVQRNYFWLPKKICYACTSMLNRHDEHVVKIKFVTPTVWREPKNKDDCYFCSTKTAGFNSSNMQKIQYAVVSSVTKASMSEISNKKDHEVAVDMSVADMEIDEAIDENMIKESSESNNDTEQEEYVMKKESDVYPRPFNHEELNDLIRDLGLPKDGAELLASRLKERNLLYKRTRVSLYRNRDESFRKYFTEEDDLVINAETLNTIISEQIRAGFEKISTSDVKDKFSPKEDVDIKQWGLRARIVRRDRRRGFG